MEHTKVFEKLEAIYCDSIGEICEPGYDNDKPHLFGDWNQVSTELQNALSEHYELEWYDEWLDCGQCGKYFRSSPNCYQWTMYGSIGNGDCTCGDCMQEYPEDFIDEAIDNPRTCVASFIDLGSLGFENLNGTFENGWHPHQTDNPEEILAEYQKRYPGKEFVFGNLGASQFYVTFEIWGRDK